MSETTAVRKAREDHDPASREKRLATQRRYKQSQKGRATVAKDARKRRRLFPEQMKARNAVNGGVRNGWIQKPGACVCGNPRVEAHHYLGYDKEHWLDVEWLCRECHREEHHAA